MKPAPNIFLLRRDGESLGTFPSIRAAAEHLQQKYPALTCARDVVTWGYTLEGYASEGGVAVLHPRDSFPCTLPLLTELEAR